MSQNNIGTSVIMLIIIAIITLNITTISLAILDIVFNMRTLSHLAHKLAAP